MLAFAYVGLPFSTLPSLLTRLRSAGILPAPCGSHQPATIPTAHHHTPAPATVYFVAPGSPVLSPSTKSRIHNFVQSAPVHWYTRLAGKSLA
jgi:hypothetical protein